MKTFKDFLEAKKDSKERIIPGKTSYDLTVPIQTKRYEDGADDSIEDVGDLLPESEQDKRSKKRRSKKRKGADRRVAVTFKKDQEKDFDKIKKKARKDFRLELGL